MIDSGQLTLEQQEKLINQLDGDMPDMSKNSGHSKGRRSRKSKAIDPVTGIKKFSDNSLVFKHSFQ